MSRASQITLATTCLGAVGIVVAVHYGQVTEKAVRNSLKPQSISSLNEFVQAMHAGVIRDFEQQRAKRERQADFEMQRALEEEYRKVQTVSDGGGPAARQWDEGRWTHMFITAAIISTLSVGGRKGTSRDWCGMWQGWNASGSPRALLRHWFTDPEWHSLAVIYAFPDMQSGINVIREAF
jgi:protein PET117